MGWATNPHTRFRRHLNQAHSGVDKTWCGNWKRAILREGFEPILTVIETGEGEGWADAEIRWIAYYRSLVGERLTNLTEGGNGSRGCTRSPETRAKMGAAKRGLKHTAVTKAKLREAKLGKPLSPEHVEKLRQSHLGLKKTPEAIEKTAAFWRGRRHTIEACEKIRASHEGLIPSCPKAPPKRSEESRQRTREALLAHYAKQGSRKMSDEAKTKISKAVKAYRASKIASGGLRSRRCISPHEQPFQHR